MPAEGIDTTLAVSRHGLRARLHRFGRRIFWGAAPFILAYAALPGWPLPWLELAVLVMASSALVMVAGSVIGTTPSPTRAHATLDDDGLRLTTPTKVTALPREALRDGLVIATGSVFVLRLHDRAGDRYELAMADQAMAWRWLHALDLSADRRAVRVVNDRVWLQVVVGYFFSGWTGTPIMLAWMAVLAALHSVTGAEPGGAAIVLSAVHAAMFGAWAMSWLVGHVDVTVGGDGLRVSKGVRNHYFPFEALEEVARDRATLVLRLRTRWRPLSLVFASDVDAAAVAVRLTAARKAWQAATPPTCLARLKVADANSAESWRAAFGAAFGDGSYRAEGLTIADLEGVVASVTVTHAQRTGAALALRDLQPSLGRTGVRVASELLVGAKALESIAPTDVGHPDGARRLRRE